MSLDELRAMVTGVQCTVTGVPAIVRRPPPDDDPVATAGIWQQQPPDEPYPVGTDRGRLGARKVMAIATSAAVPSLPRGTIIQAPETDAGDVLTWRVDGYERPVESDLMRVLLLRTED